MNIDTAIQELKVIKIQTKELLERTSISSSNFTHFKNQIEAINKILSKLTNTCEWYRDSDDEDSHFISNCNNNGFVLNEGGLKDNNMNYCNSCGCRIVETTHAEIEAKDEED